jgi:type 1 glutamine amidotransferase
LYGDGWSKRGIEEKKALIEAYRNLITLKVKSITMKSLAVSGLTVVMALLLCGTGCWGPEAASEELNMLILTGRNNHDWEQTTAVLDSTFKECGLFSVDVTTEPDTLKFEDLKKYDVLLNNWNSWPENNIRWPTAAERGLLRVVEEGGGLLFFHSSTSAFYTWTEFKQISTAAWILDSTWHGPVSLVKVSVQNQEHPITRGLSDFYILDELWINAEQNESFKVLGVALNTEEDSGEQAAIFVGGYGKGRIFHTILGHDETTLRNAGFQTLIIRATEWASTGQVSIPVLR